jgi:hypothetical protein
VFRITDRSHIPISTIVKNLDSQQSKIVSILPLKKTINDTVHSYFIYAVLSQTVNFLHL